MRNQRTLLLVALAVIGSFILFFERQKVGMRPEQAEPVVLPPLPGSSRAKNKAEQHPRALEISTPDGFINTDQISVGDLIGKKIILLDFWTYSCINCQRTIPHLNAWYEKYRDQEFVIIGIHTPEFEFEKQYENVLAAVKKFGIAYPVVLDNDYSTWHAYKNRYWPRKYLIDIDGFVVYDHIGEGAYEETERKIQELLVERARVLGSSERVPAGFAAPSGTEAAISRTPEIYFGAARNEFLANGKTQMLGPQSFILPPDLQPGLLSLEGDWVFDEEFARNVRVPAKIVLRYRAKSVYLVASADQSARLTLRRDGGALGEAAGADVRPDGEVSVVQVRDARLYTLVDDPNAEGEHTLEITILDPQLRVFTLTFG